MKYIVAAAAALLFSTTTFATDLSSENNQHKITITGGAGLKFFDNKRQIETADTLLLAIEYQVAEHAGIEAMVESFHTHFRKRYLDGRGITGTGFYVDGIYHFDYTNCIKPYVFAGVGVVGLNPSQNDANNLGNINGGVGVQYFISPILAFRTEVRETYTPVGGKNDFSANFGLSYLFDI